MNILNFGSVNFDRVYRVPHFVRPGETIAATSFATFSGGKGFNQSTAIARAGGRVAHAGCIGADGIVLRDELARDGVDVGHLRVVDAPTGHGLIQVDDSGQNCIVICGGANRMVSKADVAAAMAGFGPGDALLVQNEVSCIPEMIATAAGKGMEVVFNPAPMGPEVAGYPLDKVTLFIVNEVEAASLSGMSADEPGALLDALSARFPRADFVMTLGARGAAARFAGAPDAFVAAHRVAAVDTTAAGDTFIGFFLAARQRGEGVEAALAVANAAAAICVSRPGAAPSIPLLGEVAEKAT